MKNVKKIVTALLVCAIMVSTFAMPVSAAGDSDNQSRSSDDVHFYLPFIFGIGTHQDDTNPYDMAYKENDSSVYFKSEQFPGNYYVYTNAYVNYQVINCTQRSALVTGQGEWLIYNVIYERFGRIKACLGGVRAQGGTASGKWSPDYQRYSGDNIPHMNP